MAVIKISGLIRRKPFDIITSDKFAEDLLIYIQTKLEVKADGTTNDGIPSKTKVLGILPSEL